MEVPPCLCYRKEHHRSPTQFSCPQYNTILGLYSPSLCNCYAPIHPSQRCSSSYIFFHAQLCLLFQNNLSLQRLKLDSQNFRVQKRKNISSPASYYKKEHNLGWVRHENDFAYPTHPTHPLTHPTQTQCQQYLSC